MTAAYSMMVNISSLFALFIGMFIIYNSFAIAVTQRRSEIGILRALGAHAAADPPAVSRRERRDRPDRLAWRPGVRSADRARHRRVDRQSHQRRLRRRAARRRSRDQSDRCSRIALVIGVATSMIAALDSGAAGRARRSGAGAAEGQVSGAVGRREPRARARWLRRSALVSVGCLVAAKSRIVFYAGYVLAIARRAAARAAAVAGAVARPPAGAEVAAAGRRRAGRRQPDSGAAPHVGERRGPDALARAGDRVRRHGARELRRRSSTGWRRRSIRISSSCRRRTSWSARCDFLPRWTRSSRRCRASRACRGCGTRASCSGRRR